MHEHDEQEVAFPTLSEAQIEALAEVGHRRTFQDDEMLFQAGSRGGGFFVVLSGAVEVVDRSTGEERMVRVHGPGEFTGDIDILSRRRPVVSAVAKGETEALEVASTDVRRVLRERPALGEVLLRAFIARRELLVEAGFEGLRVMGSADSREAFALREFLSRNQVPFTWVDLDDEPGVGELLEQFGVGEGERPVVAYGGRPLLRNPSPRELADALGLRTSLGEGLYDLVVVGAGPAGLGAAVYASSEGLRTAVLDDAGPGGQAGASSKIENYLGFPTGISGAELAERATLQAQKFGARFSTPTCVTELDASGRHPVLRLDDGAHVEARCVLIATGADYRRLDVPGRERFDGLGVYYAATQTELSTCEGFDAVVVGGGNSAGQAAMFLSEHTRRVFHLLRGDDLRESMSSYLADRIEAVENIEVLTYTEIRQMEGEERLEAIEVENTESGETRRIETPTVFTFIGASPRTGWLPPEVEISEKGFVLTGRQVLRSERWTAEREPLPMETTSPGVFAAGDVRLGSTKRVASAVGEGAAAVGSIHAFLAERWRQEAAE